MEQRVSNDAYHRGYVDVPSERVSDLPHIKRAIAWASFERECDEKRPDGSVHLHVGTAAVAPGEGDRAVGALLVALALGGCPGDGRLCAGEVREPLARRARVPP